MLSKEISQRCSCIAGIWRRARILDHDTASFQKQVLGWGRIRAFPETRLLVCSPANTRRSAHELLFACPTFLAIHPKINYARELLGGTL